MLMSRLLALFLVLISTTAPAHAVCTGATLEEEYQAADVVVRARLVSELNVHDDTPSSRYRKRWGNGTPVVLYGLSVTDVFKGSPGPRINFFQERNSGSYYLDVDKEYLLFLSYIRPYPGRPDAARGAMQIRYTCGQSKPWTAVNADTIGDLRRLSRR